MLLVDGAHQCRCGRKYLVHEDEDCFLWCQFDSFTNNINELANGQILSNRKALLVTNVMNGVLHRTHGWDKVLLLVDGRDVRSICLLADNLERT